MHESSKRDFVVPLLMIAVFTLGGCTLTDAVKWADDRAGEIIDQTDDDGLEISSDKEDASVYSEGETDIKNISQESRDKIDEWLKNNGYNRYGDSPGMMYTGGTPLFDESTGESKDRYEYIFEKHSDIFLKISENN